MKFSFQAGLREYWDRRESFIKSLAQQVGAFDADLAEILEKALPQKEPQLKWKLLRELQGQTKIAYQEQIKKMLDEVNKVLEQSAPKGLRKAFEHIEPGDKEAPEYQSEEDKQFANEYDAETGEPRPEPEEVPEEPEEEEEPELEASIRARDNNCLGCVRGGMGYFNQTDLKKAGGPYIGPKGGKWADPKHTIHWIPLTGMPPAKGVRPISTGFMVPKIGDTVVTVVPGVFGMMIPLQGTVISGDEVKITGGATARKVMPLKDAQWQVKDDPYIEIHAQKQVEAYAQKQNQKKVAEKDYTQKKARVENNSIQQAIARGEHEIKQEEVHTGQHITMHVVPYNEDFDEHANIEQHIVVVDTGKFISVRPIGDPAATPVTIGNTRITTADDLKKAGGPYIGPRGGKWADPAHTIHWVDAPHGWMSAAEVVEMERRLNAEGKQAGYSMEAAYSNIKEKNVPYVRINVPVDVVNADVDQTGELSTVQQSRVKEYVERGGNFPPIRIRHSAYSSKRGVQSAFVANGNHRVAAARARGDTHIEAMMPEEDYHRWLQTRGQEEAVEKALYIGPRGGKWANPAHTISWSPDTAMQHKRKGEVAPGHIAHVIAEHGGKITAHHTDPNQAMVKVPHEHAQILQELQFELGLPHVEPVKGDKYTMIAIPKSHVEVVPPVQKPKTDKPEIPGIKASAKAGVIAKIVEQIPLHVVPHKTNPAMVMIKTPQDHKAKLEQLAATLGISAESVQVGGQNAMLAIGKQEAKLLITAMQGMPAITGVKKPVKKPAPKPQATPKSAPTGAAIPEIPAYAQAQHWAPADTVEQVQDWFKSAGVHASFPDLPTANAVSDALHRSHSAVIAHCKFIGTSAQLKAWMKSNPELAAEAKLGKHALDLTKISPLGGTAIAIAHPIGTKPYTQSVVIVQDSWWDAHKAEKEGQLEHGGFSLSKNLRDVVIHELGHVEGFALRHLKVGDSTAWEVWKKHCVPVLKDHDKKKQLMHDVSEYAATTPHEAWAEIAVMRRKGMQVPEWVQAAIDEMGIDKTPWDTMSTGWQWGG